ncbi:hypothetical protein A3D11_02345 [Candidatus Peribacteria bacterium RIFCSPHIGHO2_02_FULL_49_16]|nr:MAG: hypothetical protein A2880_03805 [Candidatus Peribacteria bacterium RIFCSPHIGHO2_01_FULL_49_38]OGJ59964.1 MAG: hypothetical protein A3D11_02345 [Candidatus Peribacteria bacterium RIFCSPHIGHO2_02_FULL_49_16]
MKPTLDTLQTQLYLANGLGFNDPGDALLKAVLVPSLEKLGIHVIEPFSDKRLHEKIAPLFKEIDETDSLRIQKLIYQKLRRVIGMHNIDHITNCDALLFAMDGGHSADDGGCWEAGFLAGLDYEKKPEKRRPVFCWRTDMRLCEFPETGVNSMFHAGSEVSGGKVIEGRGTLPKLLEEIRAWHEKLLSSSL